MHAIFINYQQFCWHFCQNLIFWPTSAIRKILFSQLFPFKLKDFRVCPLLVGKISWEIISFSHNEKNFSSKSLLKNNFDSKHTLKNRKNEKLYDLDGFWCPIKWNNNEHTLRTIKKSFVTCSTIFINYQQFLLRQACQFSGYSGFCRQIEFEKQLCFIFFSLFWIDFGLFSRISGKNDILSWHLWLRFFVESAYFDQLEPSLKFSFLTLFLSNWRIL